MQAMGTVSDGAHGPAEQKPLSSPQRGAWTISPPDHNFTVTIYGELWPLHAQIVSLSPASRRSRWKCRCRSPAACRNFLMVGLPDKAVGEARERVRAALTAMGLALPPKRVLVNLAPADVLKEGSHFDLPVALAVLAAMDVLPAEELAQFAALGELSLDGRINPVAGVLPASIAAAARELGLICPEAQGPEAGWAGDISILAAPDLLCLINHFRGTQLISAPPP